MTPAQLNTRARAYWTERERAESPLTAHVLADIERDRLSAAERREVLLHGLRQQVLEEEERKHMARCKKGGLNRGKSVKERDDKIRAAWAAGMTRKDIACDDQIFTTADGYPPVKGLTGTELDDAIEPRQRAVYRVLAP